LCLPRSTSRATRFVWQATQLKTSEPAEGRLQPGAMSQSGPNRTQAIRKEFGGGIASSTDAALGAQRSRSSVNVATAF
jgi:hypothetical protein